MVKINSMIEENATKDDVSEALSFAGLAASGTKGELIKRLLKHTGSDPRTTLGLFAGNGIARMASNLGVKGKSKEDRIEKLLTSLFPETLDPSDQPSLPDELDGIVEIPNALVYEAFVQKYDVAAIDFSATWCGPCRMMHKIFADTAPQFKGRVAFGKVDVDLNQALSVQLRISGVPTVTIFRMAPAALESIFFREVRTGYAEISARARIATLPMKLESIFFPCHRIGGRPRSLSRNCRPMCSS